MDKPLRFILDGHTPVPEPDKSKWHNWMAEWDCVVDHTRISGDRFVSTVFLGIDHNFKDSGSPELFETICFGPNFEVISPRTRCHTWEEAEAQHEVAVVKAMLG